MALAEVEVMSNRLTYDEYMAEGEINRRYDIIDGQYTAMTNPTPLHQLISFNIATLLRAYQKSSKLGMVFLAPRDVLITTSPLRIRQPDVLFITHNRIGSQSLSDPAPFKLPPEFVVEVVSYSDTRRVKAEKIADYCNIGVNECWLVGPETETVEVLGLSSDGPERVALYGAGETAVSITFPDLTMPLDEIFWLED